MHSCRPNRGPWPEREARLAWGLLTPTLASVALVIILPLLAIFWISAKPINLGDLRPTTPDVYERLRGKPKAAGDEVTVEYRLKNSSQEKPIAAVTLKDVWPRGLVPVDLDARCQVENEALSCALGDWEPGYRERLKIKASVEQSFSGPRGECARYAARHGG